MLNYELDAAIGEQKARKRGGRKHKAQWMKKPMALSEVILELYEENLRENALRCLSNYLDDVCSLSILIPYKFLVFLDSRNRCSSIRLTDRHKVRWQIPCEPINGFRSIGENKSTFPEIQTVWETTKSKEH